MAIPRKTSDMRLGRWALFALFLTAAVPAHASDDGPRAPIKRLTSTLLESMKEAETLGYTGRRNKLTPVLRRSFDFPFMARLSLGRHWQKLDASDQSQFADLFARLSIATFAQRFDGYSGQTFEIADPRDGPRGTRLVPTRLVNPDPAKETVTISFLMRPVEEQWRAVDIYLKGTYSELATKRAEYSSVIKRDGIGALMESIRARIEEIERNATGQRD